MSMGKRWILPSSPTHSLDDVNEMMMSDEGIIIIRKFALSQFSTSVSEKRAPGLLQCMM
jgi:hypothetical protein